MTAREAAYKALRWPGAGTAAGDYIAISPFLLVLLLRTSPFILTLSLRTSQQSERGS